MRLQIILREHLDWFTFEEFDNLLLDLREDKIKKEGRRRDERGEIIRWREKKRAWGGERKKYIYQMQELQ